MKYSLKVLATRLIISILISCLLALAGRFLDPEAVASIKPHIVELILAIVLIVTGVDLHAFIATENAVYEAQAETAVRMEQEHQRAVSRGRNG